MKKRSQHLVAEVPRRPARVEITIGIDLGDVWSHYCTLNEKGEVVDRVPVPVRTAYSTATFVPF
jgi:transposase